MKIESFLGLSRQISFSKTQINRVLKQLASQKAINSFSDDPVGSAVLQKVKSSLNALKVANEKNIVQAEAMTNTAEDYAAQISDKLTELHALADEAANASSGWEVYDAQYQEGLADIEALATAAQFNGIDLLRGQIDIKIQVGDSANQTQTLSWNGLSIAALGLENTSLATAGRAKSAVAALNYAEVSTDVVQAKITAAQSSLNFREDANALQIENLEEARTRLEDLDVPKATAELAMFQTLYDSQVELLSSSLTSQAEAFRLLFLKNY